MCINTYLNQTIIMSGVTYERHKSYLDLSNIYGGEMKSFITAIFSAIAISVSGTVTTLADETMVVPIKRLTVDTALKIAKATIAQCRKERVNVTVTVIDRGGDTQVVLRDTLAMGVTVDISKKKAYTAMSFNTRTAELQPRVKQLGPISTYNGFLLQGGGVPINIGGTIMGGIGVSGAPDSKTDQKCADAGLNAVLAEIEMSM